MIEAGLAVEVSHGLTPRKAAARNRRSSSIISAFGKRQCQAAWAEEYNISCHTISQRLRHGWTSEQAVSLPVGVNRIARTVMHPLSFTELRNDKRLLGQFRAREPVPLLCSGCGIAFTRAKEVLAKSIKLSKFGVFCSPRCGASCVGRQDLTEVAGVTGRTCSDCGEWKPLKKIGRKHVCNTCWNATPEARYYDYKRRAPRRGLIFEISFDDFMTCFWQRPCWYCAASISIVGIDRVDSALGYMLSNCIPCCGPCNKAKRDASQGDFLDRCRRIAALHPEVSP